jgi:uncharacterized protein
MKLDLDRTVAGRSEIDLKGEIPLDWAEDRPDRAEIDGTLTVDNLDQRFLVTGEVAATGRCTCARCLEDFDLHWQVPVEIMVLRNVDTDEGEGDTLVLRQRSGEVDLTEPLRESVVLAFPASTICREDCRGICSQCGADLNKGGCRCADDDVDPRWAGLDAIQHDEE